MSGETGSKALSAAKTKFRVHGEDGQPPLTIAEIQEINGLKLESSDEDATTFDGNGWEEVIMTLKKVNDISLKMNFVPYAETHGMGSAGLVRSFVDQTKRCYDFVFPDPNETTWTIPAYVKSIEVKATAKGKLEGTAVLKPSGKPTLA